ncbi:MAG TPA: hypothetical protein VEH56_05350 [Candidatus Saccharimonadales bacterium]|nr:hypothetical protein [Candidatus Saccharimonadales bacterium]
MAENNSENTSQTTSEVEATSEATKNSAKLQIDRPTDFKFHLAYEVYSKAWDHNPLDSVRLKLNELISSLASNENGYSDFYGQMQEYRRDGGGFRSGKSRIETSRKRDYQRTTTRNDRNRRHR